MAGYDYMRGMSNNAVQAHNDGLTTASKIGHGLTKDLIEKYCRNEEWHHTGSTFYNATNFYVKEYVLAVFGIKETEDYTFEDYRDEKAVEEYLILKESKKNKKVEGLKVVGKYAVWGGTRKHPKISYWKEFTGILKDGWIYLSDCKKKATGNWIEYSVVKG